MQAVRLALHPAIQTQDVAHALLGIGLAGFGFSRCRRRAGYRAGGDRMGPAA